MEVVTNHKGIELRVGDKIIIISDKLGDRSLSTVTLGEVLTITGFSDNGKILYHHNSLALPINSNLYKKITMEKEFVDYKTALALKELGFDEPCMASRDMNNDEGLIQIPLKQQAFRWFREKHDLIAYPVWRIDNTWDMNIQKLDNNGLLSGQSALAIIKKPTYEEAEEACLDKLIEICKNK
jgi:hypothetical protein